MFWKEQPQSPVEGAFRTQWTGGSFVVYRIDTGAEVFRIDGRTKAVTLPAGSIPSAGLTADNGIDSDNLAVDVIQVATVALTNAEIKALNTTAKELVAAPGANKYIEFLGATLLHDYGSEALTGNHDLTVGLNDGTVAVAAVVPFGDFPLKAADHVYSVKPALAFNNTAANTLNKNLALKAAGNYAGNASNDTVWAVKVSYRILSF